MLQNLHYSIIIENITIICQNVIIQQKYNLSNIASNSNNKLKYITYDISINIDIFWS